MDEERVCCVIKEDDAWCRSTSFRRSDADSRPGLLEDANAGFFGLERLAEL